jgi:hypothetical protein
MIAEEHDAKWILIISLILFFVLEGVFYYFPYHSYILFDLWWYIDFINLFVIILTVTFSTLNKVRFGDIELTYRLAVYFFLISMALILISNLRLLSFAL